MVTIHLWILIVSLFIAALAGAGCLFLLLLALALKSK